MEHEKLLKKSAKITLDQMKEYLEKTGWKFNREHRGINIYIRPEPEREFEEIILPKSEISIWFPAATLEQIKRLAYFEKREVWQVFFDFGIIIKETPSEAWFTLAPYANGGSTLDMTFIEGYATALKQFGYLLEINVKQLMQFVIPLQGRSEIFAATELEEFFKRIGG